MRVTARTTITQDSCVIDNTIHSAQQHHCSHTHNLRSRNRIINGSLTQKAATIGGATCAVRAAFNIRTQFCISSIFQAAVARATAVVTSSSCCPDNSQTTTTYMPQKLQRTVVSLCHDTSAHEGALVGTDITPNSPPVHPFRVMTFNTLADGLAQHGDFIHCPRTILDWEHRLPLLIQEILESQADIICLQEVNHFDQIYTALQPLGYAGGAFLKNPSPATRYGYPPDGLALFYKSSRFQPLSPIQGNT